MKECCDDCIYKVRTGVNWKDRTLEDECSLEERMDIPDCKFKVSLEEWYASLPDNSEIK
jgi:hypothetical protein